MENITYQDSIRKYKKYKHKYLNAKKNLNDNVLVGGVVLESLTRENITQIYDQERKTVQYTFETVVNYTVQRIMLNMYPMPKSFDGKTYYINGGIKYGGRHPDIIINAVDEEIGIKYLKSIGVYEGDILKMYTMKDIINKIIMFIRENFLSDRLLHFDDKTGSVDAARWYATVDSTTNCFIKKVFKCGDAECQQLKMGQFTLTNISALPYFIGDCREHAFLAAFLLGLFLIKHKKSNTAGILYTSAYIYNQEDNTVTYMEDHVFCIYATNENSEIHIIDPLYSKFNKYEKKILYDEHQPTIFLNDVFENCTFLSLDKNISNARVETDIKSAKIIIHCGNMIGDGTVRKIINIPKFYDGNNMIVNNFTFDKDKVYFYNKIFDRPENLIKWKSFADWC